MCRWAVAKGHSVRKMLGETEEQDAEELTSHAVTPHDPHHRQEPSDRAGREGQPPCLKIRLTVSNRKFRLCAGSRVHWSATRNGPTTLCRIRWNAPLPGSTATRRAPTCG